MADTIKISDDINLIIESLNKIILLVEETTISYEEAMEMLMNSSNGYYGEANKNISEFVNKSGKRLDSLLKSYNAAKILATATLIKMAKEDEKIANKIYKGEYHVITMGKDS